ncbi:uncharacterized protein LOC110248523 [Exaiptasia diaphana]|uniref:Bag6 BAG-similar domain-containing protein n=1 Tax=Exaiptasia diaphana TaxID=2652724 RepID=A0A913XW17_EXADI|nr:uncharacterized protein LOC110248523 [Exaiptasia diaphana]
MAPWSCKGPFTFTVYSSSDNNSYNDYCNSKAETGKSYRCLTIFFNWSVFFRHTDVVIIVSLTLAFLQTTDQRAVSSTSENMSSILRQAVLAAGVTPKTSMEALATDAQQSDDLHEAYRGEVKKAVKRRTSKDADYNPDTFPSTKDYLESS